MNFFLNYEIAVSATRSLASSGSFALSSAKKFFVKKHYNKKHQAFSPADGREKAFRNSKKNYNRKRGFGLLEIITGIAVISISIFGLTAVMNISLKISEQALNNTRASFMLSEGWEAARAMRDTSFSGKISPLAAGSDNFFEFDGAVWKATSSNIYTDGLFERKFVLENVLRDGNDDIVLSGGALDTNTKKIIVSVSWKGRVGTTTKQVSGYVMNLFNN